MELVFQNLYCSDDSCADFIVFTQNYCKFLISSGIYIEFAALISCFSHFHLSIVNVIDHSTLKSTNYESSSQQYCLSIYITQNFH